MFTEEDIASLEDFTKGYSFNSLASIDREIHKIMLNQFFETNTRKNLTVFDVGCNAGSFVREFQEYAEGHVHCFEPHPILAKYLSNTYQNITVNPCCVSNYDGEGIIHLPSRSAGLGSTIYRKEFDVLKTTPEDDPIWQSTVPQQVISRKVPFITIDKYCEENNIQNIDYLKIDVEGGEFNVFQGAKSMLHRGKIKAGQYEACPNGECLADANVSYDQLKNLLEQNGYSVIQLCQNDCYFWLN